MDAKYVLKHVLTTFTKRFCKNKFMDTDLCADFHHIDFDLHKVNLQFVITGDVEHKQENRFAPPIGTTKYIADRLSSNMQSRRQRWAQLDLSMSKACKALLFDLVELLSLGYNKHIIQQAFQESRAHDEFFIPFF